MYSSHKNGNTDRCVFKETRLRSDGFCFLCVFSPSDDESSRGAEEKTRKKLLHSCMLLSKHRGLIVRSCIIDLKFHMPTVMVEDLGAADSVELVWIYSGLVSNKSSYMSKPSKAG